MNGKRYKGKGYDNNEVGILYRDIYFLNDVCKNIEDNYNDEIKYPCSVSVGGRFVCLFVCLGSDKSAHI